VIVDLTVPGKMGGREAIAAIRAFDPNVCAIVASGYSSDPVLARYTDFGFRAVAPKPYDMENLSRLIATLLAENSANRPPHTGQ
jgi:DNA-binding NarL/FixJ family response regulator